MELGSKTLVATRLDNGLRDFGRKVMISTVVVLASTIFGATRAQADTCSDLMDIVTTKQTDTFTKRSSALRRGHSSISKTEIKTLTPAVALEDLFTFEASADAMGFKPEKTTIRATREQLDAILTLTKRNTKLVVEMAGEMHFYLETLPIRSFDDLFDLVKLRNQMDAEPKIVRDIYLELMDIVHRAQSSRANAYPPNTDVGVEQNAVLAISAMHLNRKSMLDIVQTRNLMRDIENSFPSERRLHQLQLLQVVLAERSSEPSTSLADYVLILRRLQSDLVIERNVMGFAGVEHDSPSLEQALILKILGDKVDLPPDSLVAVIQHIIRTQGPEDFDHVARVVAEGVKKLQADAAAPAIESEGAL